MNKTKKEYIKQLQEKTKNINKATIDEVFEIRQNLLDESVDLSRSINDAVFFHKKVLSKLDELEEILDVLIAQEEAKEQKSIN